ncbi:MAG: hypothetical protein COB24_08450 [Hyphomicrobiales bacterium]|nr:MAG: hypothetical protein COB24_08450 [Hyphomicrobiales bacterium]
MNENIIKNIDNLTRYVYAYIMYQAANNFYNKPTDGNLKTQHFFAIYFAPFTVFFLALDSQYMVDHYFDARPLVNILVIGCFFVLLSAVNTRLRKLMIVFVPLGLFGEIIFSLVLGLYEYRLARIPIYVPFGHAAVYACGYLLHARLWAQNNNDIMKTIFFILFSSLFIGAGWFFNDIFSFIFGFLFFYRGLRRKNWNTLYYYVALYVITLEFAGTYFEVWQWQKLALGFIPTANPPVGAVFFYIGADSLLLRIMRFIDKKQILTPLNGIRPEEKW